ncbi:MAG TPA: flagellar motor protein MotA [Alphaproteobacteria bacterium]|nr:flagellar motor protein MotA [Alphaproteobacteria bacterium]
MRLSRYLALMWLFLVVVAALAVWLAVRLEAAFLANPLLNALLVAVWLIGVAYIMMQTMRLAPEIKWVQEVQRNRIAANDLEPPPLMGSLARLMEARSTPLVLSPTALRAVLDGIAVRLDEVREIARYFIGLMIFLGLLGTFWGLLKTVGSVGGVLNSLSVTADPTELFTNLKAGLEGPLSGMGTAFGSSLLGLAGSLALGFLDLQLGQAQNRFFVDLEDWLFASSRGGAEEATPIAAVQALVEKSAASIDRFQHIMAESEESRRQTASAIQALADRLGGLTELREQDRAALEQRAGIDASLATLLARMSQALDSGQFGADAALRDQLRAIETGINRIADEQSQLRAQALEETRSELRRLARTVGIVETDKAET